MLYIYQLQELTLLLEDNNVSKIILTGRSFLHNQKHLLRTSVQGRNWYRQAFMVNQNGTVYPSSLLANNNSKLPSYPEIKKTNVASPFLTATVELLLQN